MMSDFVIENGKLNEYIGRGGDVIIPDGVVKIGSGAFWENTKVTSVVIPSSVQEIEQWAFWKCKKLKQISFSDGLEIIGSQAFSGCAGLTELTFPSTLHTVENCAFEYCKGLIKIYQNGSAALFDSLQGKAYKGIIDGYFPGDKLDSLNPDQKITAVICYLQHSDRYHTKDQQEYAEYMAKQSAKIMAELIARNHVPAVAAFLRCKILSFKNTAKAIELASNNAELTAMLLAYQNGTFDVAKEEKKRIRSMENEIARSTPTVAQMKADWGVKELPGKSLEIVSYKGKENPVVIPEKIGTKPIVKIGAMAFDSQDYRANVCTNPKWRRNGIHTVFISKNITEIDKGSFTGCSALESFEVDDENSEFTSIDGCLYSKDGTQLIRCPEGKTGDLILGDQVNSIWFRAFFNCRLTSVTLPKTMFNIGFHVFGGYYQQEFHIYLPDKIEKLDGVFEFHGILSESYILHASKGGIAERFAKEYKIKFIPLDQ